jgi:hypothetical protein
MLDQEMTETRSSSLHCKALGDESSKGNTGGTEDIGEDAGSLVVRIARNLLYYLQH